MADNRERVGRGDLEFCTALAAYLNQELTFAQVANFKVSVWTKRASYDFPFGDPAPTHEVNADKQACQQYTISVQRTRDCVRDFTAGWAAARGSKPTVIQQIHNRKPAPRPK